MFSNFKIQLRATSQSLMANQREQHTLFGVEHGYHIWIENPGSVSITMFMVLYLQ